MSAPSIAQAIAAPAVPAPISVPLRNIFLTLTLTVSTLALAGFLWREQGYEMLIVTMGWPHVALGFVFYFGKVMRGEANARTAFAVLALVTLAIWTIHYNYAITGLIYLYFLYHAFRDEIFVYLQTRARHRPGPGLYTIAGVGPAILLMLLIPQQQDFRHDLRRPEFTGAQIASIWLPISRIESGAEATNFVLHLASPPLLPYPAPLAYLRLFLIAFLGAVVVWKLVPRGGQSNQLWIYLIVLAAGFVITQTILKSSNNAGYAFPLIFQFVVVFHYWSWYVFSFDKLRVFKGARPPAVQAGSLYDRMLGYLRRAPYFTATVLAANLISAAGVFCYYRFNGPIALRFAFDYNYFLYFLVFHVTFSFRPKLRRVG